MIDAFWVPPSVHVWVGAAVLASTLLSVGVAAQAALRKRRLASVVTPAVYAALLVAQLSLMVQVLIGVKLLDQGLGPLQLYIHFLGGLGALLFYVLFYWLPRSVRERRWTATGLASLGFAFALMSFAIGSMYVSQGA